MPEKPVTHGIEHRPSSFDPAQTDPWTYVSDGDTAWDSGTTYNPGDTAENGVFVYLCMLRNTNLEPGVASGWAQNWRIAAPVFQNGWSNSGGSYVSMRYRLAVGPPHVTDGNDGSLIDYSDHQVELQGSVTGGTPGTTVFTLPTAYAPDSDLHLSAADDTGAFTCVTVQTGGDVINGFV